MHKRPSSSWTKLLVPLGLLCLLVVPSLLIFTYKRNPVVSPVGHFPPKDVLLLKNEQLRSAKAPETFLTKVQMEDSAPNDRPKLSTSSTPKEAEVPFEHTSIPPTKEAALRLQQLLRDAATSQKPPPLQPTLVSLGKPVTSSVRGNLGPASVVTNESIEDWLKDRWQAARNMQGEAIPGAHWLVVDLQDIYEVTSILLDWETAYSKDWAIQVHHDYFDNTSYCFDAGKFREQDEWQTLCSSSVARTLPANPDHNPVRQKQHVVQRVDLAAVRKLFSTYGQQERTSSTATAREEKSTAGRRNIRQRDSTSSTSKASSTAESSLLAARYVRLLIHRPATRWGVSLWRLQIWGRPASPSSTSTSVSSSPNSRLLSAI